MKKLKYVTPTTRIIEFDPGCILASSTYPGGWSIDGSGVGSMSSTGASSGGWSIDYSGTDGIISTGTSIGGWSTD